MAVKWIEENGTKILLVDYSSCNSVEQMLETLHEQSKILAESRKKVHCLEDYSDIKISTAFMDQAKVVGKEMMPYMDKNALIGITGLKKILLKAYITFSGQKGIRTFENRQDAIAWMTAAEDKQAA